VSPVVKGKVTYFADSDRKLEKDESVASALRVIAKTLEKRVQVPKGDYSTTTKAGVSHKGAFAQIILKGPRAIFIEFGTTSQKALAPLRRAIFGVVRGR
jgi:hypothetical protein